MERLLNRNRIFVGRMKGVGVLSKEEAINRSCSGRSPGQAASQGISGKTSRIRHTRILISSLLRLDGDCFSRYMVRMAEMKESVKIVEQAWRICLPGR